MPAKPVQAATVEVKTTKDITLSQEQLSTLFKVLVAGTKVLPIGVVNDVPGVLLVAHALTLQDVESRLCHLKRCDQLKPQKVVKGTESATLMKPDEPVELKGHRDPDPEQLMLPEIGANASPSPGNLGRASF